MPIAPYGRARGILFLSFARATVSRIVDAIEHEQKIPREQKRRIDVETYHSFFWRILKAHGYLVGLPRRLDILTPPGEAIALSDIRSGYAAASKLTDVQKAEKKMAEETERLQLSGADGRICFDLFALLVVFTAPRFDQGLGVGQGRKPVFVQAFVAEAPVEGLDVGVLVRLAGFNETQGQPLRVRPCEHRGDRRTPSRCPCGESAEVHG